MGKMYTLDNKLLTETSEIRIGDKVYPVDDRVKTVKKIQEISKNITSVGTFFANMDWTSLGSGIGEGITSIFTSINW